MKTYESKISENNSFWILWLIFIFVMILPLLTNQELFPFSKYEMFAKRDISQNRSFYYYELIGFTKNDNRISYKKLRENMTPLSARELSHMIIQNRKGDDTETTRLLKGLFDLYQINKPEAELTELQLVRKFYSFKRLKRNLERGRLMTEKTRASKTIVIAKYAKP